MGTKGLITAWNMGTVSVKAHAAAKAGDITVTEAAIAIKTLESAVNTKNAGALDAETAAKYASILATSLGIDAESAKVIIDAIIAKGTLKKAITYLIETKAVEADARATMILNAAQKALNASLWPYIAILAVAAGAIFLIVKRYKEWKAA
jgi:hypothetical protein